MLVCKVKDLFKLRLSLRFGVGHWYLATKRTKYYNLKEEHYRMKFWCIAHVVNNNSAKCRISGKFARLLCERHPDPFKFMLTESGLHTLCKQQQLFATKLYFVTAVKKDLLPLFLGTSYVTDASSCRYVHVWWRICILIASAAMTFIKNQNHTLMIIRSPEKKNKKQKIPGTFSNRKTFNNG